MVTLDFSERELRKKKFGTLRRLRTFNYEIGIRVVFSARSSNELRFGQEWLFLLILKYDASLGLFFWKIKNWQFSALLRHKFLALPSGQNTAKTPKSLVRRYRQSIMRNLPKKSKIEFFKINRFFLSQTSCESKHFIRSHFWAILERTGFSTQNGHFSDFSKMSRWADQLVSCQVPSSDLPVSLISRQELISESP